jgi:ATP-binding cassette, subfamily B, bacterial
MALALTRTTRRQPRAAATQRARLAALRYAPKFIQLMWQTHRGYAVAMALLRLLRAVIPLGTL